MRDRHSDAPSARDATDRSFDGVHEDDASSRAPSRAGTLVLASIGGACIVFAAIALVRSPARAKITSTDPLGDLVAKTHPAGADSAPRPEGVGPSVTFPATLSDSKQPTTALEAVREAAKGGPEPLPFALPPGAPTTPPAPEDRLPVVPLPAQNVLEATPATLAAGDTLSNIARQAYREDAKETAPPGTPGGYQLQVSSFKNRPEADAFSAALRRRGHRAHVESADVHGRGTWYRVHIGPFKYKHAAVVYRQDFEAKERMVTFIVDPPKPSAKIRPSGDEP